MAGGDVPALVIDRGSGVCKAGFAGDAAPIAIFPWTVGFSRLQGAMNSTGYMDLDDANESQRKQGILSTYLEDGLVTNWDDVEKVNNEVR